MFGRVGVLDLLLPALLVSMTLWNVPPVRMSMICYGMTLGILGSS